jgi:hypothetical protein
MQIQHARIILDPEELFWILNVAEWIQLRRLHEDSSLTDADFAKVGGGPRVKRRCAIINTKKNRAAELSLVGAGVGITSHAPLASLLMLLLLHFSCSSCFTSHAPLRVLLASLLMLILMVTSHAHRMSNTSSSVLIRHLLLMLIQSGRARKSTQEDISPTRLPKLNLYVSRAYLTLNLTVIALTKPLYSELTSSLPVLIRELFCRFECA